MVGTWGLEEYRALHFATMPHAVSKTHFLTACGRSVELHPMSMRGAHTLMVCAACFSARESIWVPMDEDQKPPAGPFDADQL